MISRSRRYGSMLDSIESAEDSNSNSNVNIYVEELKQIKSEYDVAYNFVSNVIEDLERLDEDTDYRQEIGYYGIQIKRKEFHQHSLVKKASEWYDTICRICIGDLDGPGEIETLKKDQEELIEAIKMMKM